MLTSGSIIMTNASSRKKRNFQRVIACVKFAAAEWVVNYVCRMMPYKAGTFLFCKRQSCSNHSFCKICGLVWWQWWLSIRDPYWMRAAFYRIFRILPQFAFAAASFVIYRIYCRIFSNFYGKYPIFLENIGFSVTEFATTDSEVCTN